MFINLNKPDNSKMKILKASYSIYSNNFSVKIVHFPIN